MEPAWEHIWQRRSCRQHLAEEVHKVWGVELGYLRRVCLGAPLQVERGMWAHSMACMALYCSLRKRPCARGGHSPAPVGGSWQACACTGRQGMRPWAPQVCGAASQLPACGASWGGGRRSKTPQTRCHRSKPPCSCPP
jgi:hypothetical protein